MNNIFYKMIGIFIIGILGLCIMPIQVNAALQANGGAVKTYTVDEWILNIRQMQASGGTLGLANTISTEDLTSNNKNLDIHMQKNTEYGAMAILSASAYGNPNRINAGETTTGNASGIVVNLNNEWVAAICEDFEGVNFQKAAGKYKNIYTTTYEPKIGDAITETTGWHGSGEADWMIKNTQISGLVRGLEKSVFSYWGNAWNWVDTNDAYYLKMWATRAVIVVGNGI